MNCTDKFLKYSERVGARFAEHNAGVPAYYFLILFLLTTPSISDVVEQAQQQPKN